MTLFLMETRIYVDDLGLFYGLTIEGYDTYTTIILTKEQSLEVADRMEGIVSGRLDEPLDIVDGQDSLHIEKAGWRCDVRIVVNRVSGILDGPGVREVAYDLRHGWEGMSP